MRRKAFMRICTVIGILPKGLVGAMRRSDLGDMRVAETNLTCPVEVDPEELRAAQAAAAPLKRSKVPVDLDGTDIRDFRHVWPREISMSMDVSNHNALIAQMIREWSDGCLSQVRIALGNERWCFDAWVVNIEPPCDGRVAVTFRPIGMMEMVSCDV